MATTANGLPYPIGTDAVVQGDDAIGALAGALDRRSYGHRLEHRSVAVTPNAAGGWGITYARPFASTPDVIVVCTSARAGFVPVLSLQAGGVSAGGCSGLAANAMGGAAVTETVYIAYVAVGPDPNV